MIYPKVSSGTKRIAIISLLLFLIVTLFISCVYLLLSKNSKIYHNIDILSNEKHKDNINEEDNRRSLMHRAISSLNSNSMVGLERNVLLVTNHISKTPNGQSNISPDVLFNILTHIRKVNLTILDAYDKKINETGINYLKNFHLVVIDFCDGGYNLCPNAPSFIKALMQYIKEGGTLFTTHDQFDDTHNRFITQEALEMLNLLGFVHLNSWEMVAVLLLILKKRQLVIHSLLPIMQYMETIYLFLILIKLIPDMMKLVRLVKSL